jgi:hypothetical protein
LNFGGLKNDYRTLTLLHFGLCGHNGCFGYLQGMVMQALCREIFYRDWLILTLMQGQPQWSSSHWLNEWEDFLEQNYLHSREQGITVRTWLRTLRALDERYIGADWMVTIPRNARNLDKMRFSESPRRTV